MRGQLPRLAQNGHGVMSDLSPLCAQERTWIIRRQPVVAAQRALIPPPASPHTVYGRMDKDLYAGTAEDQGPASRDADRGRPHPAPRAEAPAEGQKRSQLKAAYLIPECKNLGWPSAPTQPGVPTQAASARSPRRGRFSCA